MTFIEKVINFGIKIKSNFLKRSDFAIRPFTLASLN